MKENMIKLPVGTVVVNLTPHELFFHHPGHNGVSKNGDNVENAFVVPPSGFTADAEATESSAGERGGAALVKTVFRGSSETHELIENFITNNPDVILVGSIISAQAYPGKVCGLVPAEGFERVPPPQKRMRQDKFTTF